MSSLLVACASTGSQSGSPSGGDAKPIELRAVTFLPKQNEFYFKGLERFQEEVEKRLAGRVTVKYLGGPDIVPAFEQFEAVGKGVAELAVIPTNYSEPYMAVSPAMELSQLTPMQEREQGVYEWWRQEFDKALNVVYLFQVAQPPHHLWTNREVTTLDDFKGLNMRVAPMQRPLVEALGGGPVSMPPGEIYTGVERKVIDGFGWPSVGVLDLGLHEVTKYRIDPGFYIASTILVMNADVWKKLPDDVRAEIEKIVKELEQEMYEYTLAMDKQETDMVQQKGVTILKLPQPLADQYLDTAYDEMWARILKNAPEAGKKIKEMTDRR